MHVKPYLCFFKNCAKSLVRRVVGLSGDLEMEGIIQPCYAFFGACIGGVLGVGYALASIGGDPSFYAEVGKAIVTIGKGIFAGGGLGWGVAGLRFFWSHDLPKRKKDLAESFAVSQNSPAP